MTIGEIRILLFLKNSRHENDIDIDISASINMTLSEVKHFASKLEQGGFIIDVSNDYQNSFQVQAWKLTNEGLLKLKEIESLPKKEKLNKIPKSDGTFIYRPAKQDITPKAFEVNPITMIAAFETPTERRMLWIIANYPYILNMFFMHDLGGGKKENCTPDSKMGQSLKVMQSLKSKHFIKQSKDMLTWRITLTGYFYRVTSHYAFPLIATVLAIVSIITTITFGILNYTKK